MCEDSLLQQKQQLKTAYLALSDSTALWGFEIETLRMRGCLIWVFDFYEIENPRR